MAHLLDLGCDASGDLSEVGADQQFAVELGAGLLDLVAEVGQEAGGGLDRHPGLGVGLLAEERTGGEGRAKLPRGRSDLLGERARERRYSVGVPGGRAGHHVYHGGGVAHRARQAAPACVATPALAKVGGHCNSAPGCLEAHEAAGASRDAQGAAAVAAVPEGDGPRCDECGRASRGASGGVLGVPRIAGGSLEPSLGGAQDGQLRKVSLGHEDQAGTA